MPEQNGTLIVIEGSDGSGKSTQFRLLSERLKAVGYDIEVFKFPQYDEPSSHFIKRYLNGEYGPASSISPYTASLFYALDRYEAAPHIRKALEQGKVVLIDRYVGSNMAHQGSKFTEPVQQRGFFIWADSIEYQLLNIPRPTISYYLRVPAEISQKLMARENRQRSYTDKSHDEHEKDIEHLKSSVATYDTLCQLFPKDFQAIECTQNGTLLSIPEINNLMWQSLQPYLPAKLSQKPRSVTLNLAETKSEKPTKTEGNIQQTPLQGEEVSIELDKLSLLATNHLKMLLGASVKIDKIYWSNDFGYEFYVPTILKKETLATYKAKLNKVISLYKQMHESLKPNSSQENLSGVVPLAALSKVVITAKPLELHELISKLGLSPLKELRWAAKQVQSNARQQKPKLFEQPHTITGEDSLKDFIKKIAGGALSHNLAASTDTVTLKGVWPRNEFDLLADSLYPLSNLTLDDIRGEVSEWSYTKKQETLSEILSINEASVLNQVRYKWNVIEDSINFDDFISNHQVSELQAQSATPRYGYRVPEYIENAGIDELYLACFDESLSLFSKLQEEGMDETASYSTLLGHKLRWQFVTNAGPLRQKSDKPTSEIVELMRNKISEAHPMIADKLSQPEAKRPAIRAGSKKTNEQKPVNKKPSSRRHRKPRK